MKNVEKSIFSEFLKKLGKNNETFREKNQFRSVQRIGNLVDLEKRCKMSIWLQNFALIQPRTSPLKFDNLAEKSEKDSVSNLASKRSTAMKRSTAGQRAEKSSSRKARTQQTSE